MLPGGTNLTAGNGAQSAQLAIRKSFAGKEFWVCNRTGAGGSVNNPGTPELPFDTLSTANSACTAGNGDTIYLMEGHAETVTAAAGATITKSGVQVIGLGTGALRPTFSFTTAAAASFDITAASVTLQNCILSNAIDQQTAMLNISAADVAINSCELRMTATLAATNYALIGILTTAAALRLKVNDIIITGSGAGAAAGTVRHTNGITIVGGDGIVISGGAIRGRFSATLGCVQVITTATTNLTVQNIYMTNSTTAAAKAFVDTVTASTGFLNGLRMQILTGTAPVTGATMSWGLNYYAAAIATAMTAI